MLRSMPRTRLAAPLFALLLGTAAVFASTGAVRAEPPQQLSERLTDLAGVFSDAQRNEAEAAIDAVAEDVSLWAVWVSTTDGLPAPDYATELAAINGLGGNDAVLVVAIEDRRYGMWV